MSLKNPERWSILFFLFLASGLEAGVAIFFLFSVPADPKNAILLGYSIPRWMAIFSLGFIAGICIRQAIALRRNSAYYGRIERSLSSDSGWIRVLLLAFLIAIFTTLLVFISPRLQHGRWAGVIDRLEPLAAWVFIFSNQFFFAIILLKNDFKLNLKNRWLAALVWAIFLAVFTVRGAEMVNLTRIVDLQTNHSVVSGVDDIEYIAPAINLIHGYGYVQTLVLPLEVYHTAPVAFLTPHSSAQFMISQRPPGTSLLLAVIYGLMGTETIHPRMALIFLAWLTGILLLLMGTYQAGWIGAIAGGLAGLYYCFFSQAVDYALGLGVINSEIPGVFWFVVFSISFANFLNKKNNPSLCLAAFALSSFILTRGNYLPAVFLLPLWMIFFLGKKYRKKSLLFFTLALLPLFLWTLYLRVFQTATGYTYQPQSVSAFAITNNLDVLEGVGPAHINRGDWPPQDGVYLANGLKPDYWPKAGENPTLKALRFWWDYRDELPTLFYRKLKVGTWYHDGEPRYPLGRGINSLFIGGIGFIFASLGLRPARRNNGIFPGFSARAILNIQFIQIVFLFLISNYLAFWLVLLLWGSILFFALSRPYGDAVKIPFEFPSWMTVFILCYMITTMIFASDRQRYHAQLDPVVMMVSLLGIGVCLQAGFTKILHARTRPFNDPAD